MRVIATHSKKTHATGKPCELYWYETSTSHSPQPGLGTTLGPSTWNFRFNYFFTSCNIESTLSRSEATSKLSMLNIGCLLALLYLDGK